MKPYTRVPRFKIFGAPVFVHWSVLLVVALLLMVTPKSLLLAVVTVGSYLAIIVLHEAGHAVFAKRLGLRPLAIHVGLLHGKCTFEEPESAKQDYLVAWGGVIAQLAVAVPLVVLNAIFGFGGIDPFGPVVTFLGYVSFAIAAFNLIPAPGLDGEKAWRLVPLLVEEWRSKRFVPSSRKKRKVRIVR